MTSVRRIINIDPPQLGTMLAAIYGMLGAVFGVVVLVVALLAPKGTSMGGIGVGFALLMPIMYGVFGFIGGLISAVIYNSVAGRLGGIEVTVSE